MILDCPICHSRFLIPDAALGNGGRTVRCGRCRHQWFQAPDRAAELFPLDPAQAAPAAPIARAQTAEPGKRPEPAGEAPSAKGQFADAMMGVIDHLEQQSLQGNPLPDGATYDEDGVVFYERAPESDTPYDERLVPALRPPLPASWWLRGAALAACLLALLTLAAAHASFFSARLPASLPLLHALGVAPSTGLMLSDVQFQMRPEAGNADLKRFVIDCAVRNLSLDARALPNLRLQLYNRAGERMVEENHLLAPIATIAPGDDAPCDIPSPALRSGTAETMVLDLGSPLELWQRASLY